MGNMADRLSGDIPVDMWQNMSRMVHNVMEEVGMWDVVALVAVMFIGLGLGGVALAVFFYAVERLQAYGRDKE